MTTLTATARGRVTLQEDILKHLGIQPGGRIRLELLPDGRAELMADQPEHSWRQVYGILSGKGNGAPCSIDEIGDAIAEAGAEAGTSGLVRS